MGHLFPDSLTVILLRLFLAFLAGAIMGLERERHFKDVNRQRGAGFRTYTLTCFGSCLFGLASIYGFPAFGSAFQDTGRIAAQVVAGVGFLGAGAIIKTGSHVKGLTTAAGMWTASAIGLMLSAGMYIPALSASVFAYIILDFHHLFPKVFSEWKETRQGSNAPDAQIGDRVTRRTRSLGRPNVPRGHRRGNRKNPSSMQREES
ncbi:MgtC/SapB family protein [Effusibacillus consociatus]|uniref:MgtC/SapB family protein n=1 Tax=Effusibacillus consociatus TaxID=1117041 RepID=A0ABV9Q8A4_9BACL